MTQPVVLVGVDMAKVDHFAQGIAVGGDEVLDQVPRVAPEIAPVVLVHEPGGSDRGPGRQRAHLSLLAMIQRPVDRQELVVLVLAHHTRGSGDHCSARRAHRQPD